MRYHFIPTRVPKILKAWIPNADENVEQLKFSDFLNGTKIIVNKLRKLAVSYKVKCALTKKNLQKRLVQECL